MRAFLIFCLAVASAPAVLAQSFWPDPFGPIRWSTVESGQDSKIAARTARLITNEFDWNQVWRDLRGLRFNEPGYAPRYCDFMTENMLLINLGRDSMPGSSVDVQNIWRANAWDWQVEFTITQPWRSYDTGGFGSAYTLVRVAKQGGNPTFVARTVAAGWPVGWGYRPPQHGCAPGVWIMTLDGRLLPYQPKKRN